MTAPAQDPRVADVVSMTAHYNLSHHLDAGHSLPLGEQWVPGSTCEHLLVSLPYLHGPDLECCELPGGYARILWLLPVTNSDWAFHNCSLVFALVDGLSGSPRVSPMSDSSAPKREELWGSSPV